MSFTNAVEVDVEGELSAAHLSLVLQGLVRDSNPSPFGKDLCKHAEVVATPHMELLRQNLVNINGRL